MHLVLSSFIIWSSTNAASPLMLLNTSMRAFLVLTVTAVSQANELSCINLKTYIAL
jgi:hypothetical protein